MKFYTNFIQKRNEIYVRGFDNGRRFQERVEYKPYLFINSKNSNSKYRTLKGQQVDKIDFESISDARDFVNKYDGVSGFTYFGLTDWKYLYIFDNYKGTISFDPDKIRVLNIDLECKSDDGFPDISEANKEITAITIQFKDEYFAFGCGKYTPANDKIFYFKCSDEIELLHKFIDMWCKLDPDVITGWNIEFFDIPYLVNRIRVVLGDYYARKLSPWEILDEKEVFTMGKNQKTYMPVGVSILDYMHLYKNFTYSQQESYSLNNIAMVELGEKKIDYSEYEDLNKLYIENFQKFMEYNIHDTTLVKRLEDKNKFIELVYSFAYDAKVNFNDTLATVKPWDIIIHNFLLDRCVVIPKFIKKEQTYAIPGGHVKSPYIGLHNWVVSVDLRSLYPHLIMQYNISPEMFVNKLRYGFTVEQLLNGKAYDIANEYKDYSMTANLCLFKKNKQGFLAEIMEKMFADRKEYTKLMEQYELENEKTPSAELKNLITKYHNLQLSKKIQINAAYGALANQWFRWFDEDLASAITLSGQLTIQWAERYVNKYLNMAFKTEDVDYVIASDTDSLYISMEKFVEIITKGKDVSKDKIVDAIDAFCKTNLQKALDKAYEELAEYMNAFQNKMFMARENIGDKAIWTGKKRYIMNVLDSKGIRLKEPKLKIMGIEAIRSSTPMICRQTIKDTLKIIVNGTESEVMEYVANFRKQFITLPFEDIATPSSVNGLTKYSDRHTIYKSGTPMHVKGALLYNKILRDRELHNQFPTISDGDKIKFAYLKSPNPVKDTVIACPTVLPRQLDLDRYIDKEKQFERSFATPIKTILDAIGWQIEKKESFEDLI